MHIALLGHETDLGTSIFNQPHLKATHPRLTEPFITSSTPRKDMAHCNTLECL
jgi:hypothetical protein